MPNQVQWPIPLIRQKPQYPGVIGVKTDNHLGLRSDVSGVVFYVDPNLVNATDAGNDGTDPEYPLATVAYALTLCRPYLNDTIAVMGNGGWFYADGVNRILPVAEEVTITVPGVRLVGVMPASSMGVVWTPASDGGTCITIHAMDVTVEGFCFTEGQTYAGCNAIYAEWDGVTLWGENLVIRNCMFDDTVDIAIQLEFSWYCDIYNNTFSQCDAQGIYVDPAGSGVAYCRIMDNSFHDCVAAIVLGDGADNIIHANRIYNASAEAGAVATDEGIAIAAGSSNMVTDNWFSCLLPVPANGDWDDLNTATDSDAWVNNHCLDGDNVTNPL